MGFALTGCATQGDLDAAYERGKADTYQQAYDEGYEQGYQVAEKDTYQQAYDAGFYAGKDEGYSAGQKLSDQLVASKEDSAYWRGYSEAQQAEDGYQYGYEMGHSAGYWEGYHAASEEIQSDLEDGDAWDWIESEHEDDIQRRTSQSWEDGYSAGYDDGYDDGYHAGSDY